MLLPGRYINGLKQHAVHLLLQLIQVNSQTILY